MRLETKALKQRPGCRPFGCVISGISPAELDDESLQAELRELWLRCGVLILRDLCELSAQQLVRFAGSFGAVETALDVSRSQFEHPDVSF